MIRIKYFPEELRLQVRGHANYAPSGQDIVCAGVSALYGALLLHPMVVQSTEHDWLILQPVTGAHSVMRPLFELIMAALDDMAGTYPDHIKLHSYR